MTRDPDTHRAIAEDAARDRALAGEDAIGGHLNPEYHSFTAGVITGGMIGMVLALAFAPRTGGHFRRRLASAGKELDSAVSDRRQGADAYVAHAIGPFSHRAAASGVAVAVANAHDVAESANSVKS